MAQKQIRFLIGTQPITRRQQLLVQSLPKAKVDEILKRDVIIAKMTHFEFTRVMNLLQDQNQLAPKVYNHPIISSSNYEYGWQESTKCPDNRMYYIVYYDLLMVDIDSNRNVETLELQVHALEALEEQVLGMNLTGRLYQTYNGYHFFVTSKPIYHKSAEATSIMDILHCDTYYMAFAYLNGYKVRLNPKDRPDEAVAATYLRTIGAEPEDPDLVALLHLHDTYLLQHQQQPPP